MLIAFDEGSYNRTIQTANDKIKVLNQAIQWAEKHIVVFDKKKYSESFTRFFTTEYYESNKSKIQLDIRIDKLLELVGINIMELRTLEDKFNSIDAQLDFSDGVKPIVDKTPFETWTSSSEENDKLRMGRKLIEVLDACESFTKVYPVSIQQATSNFLQYDIRKGKYFVNI